MRTGVERPFRAGDVSAWDARWQRRSTARPVVMSHGHARRMIGEGQVDWLLVPHLIREPLVAGFRDSHHCAYVQAHPSVLRALDDEGLSARLLAPVVQMNQPVRYQVERLAQVLCKPLGGDENGAAPGRGGCSERPRRPLPARRVGWAMRPWLDIEARNELGIVCVGRPYNTTDRALTLDLPAKMAAPRLHRALPGHAGPGRPLDPARVRGHVLAPRAEDPGRRPRPWRGIPACSPCTSPTSAVARTATSCRTSRTSWGARASPTCACSSTATGRNAGYLTRVEAALESFHSYSGIPRPTGDNGTCSPRRTEGRQEQVHIESGPGLMRPAGS